MLNLFSNMLLNLHLFLVIYMCFITKKKINLTNCFIVVITCFFLHKYNHLILRLQVGRKGEVGGQFLASSLVLVAHNLPFLLRSDPVFSGLTSVEIELVFHDHSCYTYLILVCIAFHQLAVPWGVRNENVIVIRIN